MTKREGWFVLVTVLLVLYQGERFLPRSVDITLKAQYQKLLQDGLQAQHQHPDTDSEPYGSGETDESTTDSDIEPSGGANGLTTITHPDSELCDENHCTVTLTVTINIDLGLFEINCILSLVYTAPHAHVPQSQTFSHNNGDEVVLPHFHVTTAFFIRGLFFGTRSSTSHTDQLFKELIIRLREKMARILSIDTYSADGENVYHQFVVQTTFSLSQTPLFCFRLCLSETHHHHCQSLCLYGDDDIATTRGGSVSSSNSNGGSSHLECFFPYALAVTDTSSSSYKVVIGVTLATNHYSPLCDNPADLQLKIVYRNGYISSPLRPFVAQYGDESNNRAVLTANHRSHAPVQETTPPLPRPALVFVYEKPRDVPPEIRHFAMYISPSRNSNGYLKRTWKCLKTSYSFVQLH